MRDASLESAYAYAAEMLNKHSRPSLPRYIRRDDLRQMVPLADTTIYEMERRNEFPNRVYFTPRCPVWDLSEVEGLD